jgi:pimeloyl-ACP methyl ester carboxylesterase
VSDTVGFGLQYRVNSGGISIAVHATEEPSRRRPVAVLLHGAAYLSQVWNGVLPALAASYTVLAVDRRGHGLSDQPSDGYDLSDFADDLVAVVDQVDIREAFGIGHSAGATDILLAAARRPKAFSRLFVVEPTAMLVGNDDAFEPPLGDLPRAALEKIHCRANYFDSKSEAVRRLKRAPAFLGWQDMLLSTFVDHGLVPEGDGFTLRCGPKVEAAMLYPIFRVMEQSYRRSALFGSLAELSIPLRIASCEHSGPLYHPMVSAVKKLVPHATEHAFATGHCVAQQDPDAFAAALLAFDEHRQSMGRQ